MSLKEWKNKELNTLLVEKWGFGKIQEQVEEISEETLEEDEETLEESEETLEESGEALEERIAKAIVEKLLQNESLLKKLRGK